MTLQRALAYLEKLPPALSGSGGHDATLRAACECVRFGLSDGEAWQALQWFNAQRCQPQWKEKELRHKLADAQKIVAASGQTGVRAARPMRLKAAQQWRPPPTPASLRLTYASKVARPSKHDSPAQQEGQHAARVAIPDVDALRREHIAALPELPDRAKRDYERVTRILTGDEVARLPNVIRQTMLADGRALVTWHRPKRGEVARPGQVAIPQSPDDDPGVWDSIMVEESAATAFAESVPA